MFLGVLLTTNVDEWEIFEHGCATKQYKWHVS
jgi:hypothetical protein